MKPSPLLMTVGIAVVTAFAPPNHVVHHNHYHQDHHQDHHHSPATGHHHPSTTWTHHPSSALHVSWWDRDEESRHAAMHHNIMRTDLRNFLTQRSIQAFIILCNTCRDPHTVKWLQDFGEWGNLEDFHGTGALNITKFPVWSAVLMDLMREPEDVVVVSVKRRGRGMGGWSKNNPYMDNEDKYVEFNIDIDPPSLAGRILAVREQIAAEWVSDLETLKVANDMVLESYNEKLKAARAEEEARDNDDEECEDSGNYDDLECVISKTERPTFAFDRNAMFLMKNSNDYTEKAPSMLRQGNFDLLCLLATQESIHRVLRDYVDAGNEHEVSFQWFRDFYVERVAKYFDGNQEYSSADNFLEELLLTSPSVKAGDNGKMGLVDPLRIAEDIIAMRSRVAMEWKDMMSATKDEHTIVRKELLDKQMLKWGQKPAAPVEPKPEPKQEAVRVVNFDEVEVFGEFQ